MQENLKHVSDLYEAAVKADLDLGCAASLSDDRLAELYNGCGPEWLPAQIRKKLTRRLAIFEPAFLIHDTDFASSDGSTFAFAQANDRLEMNCLALANYTYPWYSWRRYRARLAALEIASLCRRYGWKAYRSACGATAAQPAAKSSSPDARAMLGLTLALTLLALSGCRSGAPKAKDANLRGMYANTATETVAIGSAKITVLPDSLESFVAHYSEDTAFLNPSEKTRFLDIYMTGTNCTAAASNVISTVCQAFTAVATTDGKKEEE